MMKVFRQLFSLFAEVLNVTFGSLFCCSYAAALGWPSPTVCEIVELMGGPC